MTPYDGTSGFSRPDQSDDHYGNRRGGPKTDGTRRQTPAFRTNRNGYASTYWFGRPSRGKSPSKRMRMADRAEERAKAARRKARGGSAGASKARK